MIGWIIFGFFLICAYLFYRADHHLRFIRTLVILVIAILLFFSLKAVLSSDSVDLSSPTGVLNAIYFYVGWLGETTVELWEVGTQSFSLAGNVVKVDSSVDSDSINRDVSFFDWVADKIRRD
jgi:hypothetical protein